MNNLNILLISEKYVKSRSAVMDNVEDKFIRNNILEAQDINIQYTIGSELYEDVLSGFTNYQEAILTGVTGITVADYVSAEYLTLVDNYVQPALLYYTLYQSMFNLYSKITNKGIVTQTSDYSETISDAMFNRIRADYENKAEYYAERLMEFLLANQEDYPMFLNHNSDIDTIEPETGTNFFSGMYLKSGKSDCYFDKNKRDM